jgi:mono/diheme cytochrome c family protein
MNILRPLRHLSHTVLPLVLLFVLLLLAALLLTHLRAQAADVFDFIPSGGRTLLAKTLASRPPADEVKALLSAKHTREEWLSYLQGHNKAISGLQRLGDKELLTLADYLSFNMPLPPARIPANPAQAKWEKLLPEDGRDFALEYCQSCHIITVVITQDKLKNGWLGTMHKPSHIQIKLTEAQREALASYLVINAAISIEDVPEELRAGGATY